MEKKIKRVPKIDENWWRICTMPDLGEIGQEDPLKQDVVDHGFLHLPDGKWLLWGAIRGTKIGHPIYAWEADSLEQEHWEEKGVVLRAEKQYGERVSDSGDELVCAPFFIEIGGKYYCFYNSEGIHLLESEDGRNYRRVIHHNGTSRNHDGGRDPMVIKIGDKYFAYSCVTTVSANNWKKSFVIVRTSENPVSTEPHQWSDYTIVAEGGRCGNGPVSAESPFVVEMDGYFYMFRSSSISFHTFVYRSEDPYNFGINDDSKLIAEFPLKAPELVLHEGQWYISDLSDFNGIKMAKMTWEEE
ncbi:MAG: hypothetical protein ACOCVL_00075 [Candidatus Sumerlaeota bacterium]